MLRSDDRSPLMSSSEACPRSSDVRSPATPPSFRHTPKEGLPNDVVHMKLWNRPL